MKLTAGRLFGALCKSIRQTVAIDEEVGSVRLNSGLACVLVRKPSIISGTVEREKWNKQDSVCYSTGLSYFRGPPVGTLIQMVAGGSGFCEANCWQVVWGTV